MTQGPLDEMFPGWRDEAPAPKSAVHSRVLETPLGEDGAVAFVLIVWEDPGGAAALHAAMRHAIESTFLSELSRPASELVQDENSRHVTELRVLLFADVPGVSDAVRAFGLEEAKEDWPDCVAQVRGEASRLGFEIDEPNSQWRASFSTAENANALEQDLRTRVDGHVFGEQPGFFFAALNDVLEKAGAAPLPPKAESLDVMEELVALEAPGQVHWIPPITFQALCDAVAVCAVKELGRVVQWAPSEAEESGFVPPPTIRLQDGKGWAHVPLARDLMRWRVMPRQADERVPPLSAWLNDRFGRA